MATTKTKDNATETAPVVDDILANMEEVTEIVGGSRGRQPRPEVLKIREQLEKMLVDRTARAFRNLTEDNKEEYAKLVRSAGNMTTGGRQKIATSTRWNPSTSTLIWGPKEVVEELSKKGKAA